jgi:pimeloyl-ACP methyl ester carboxylesterase
MATYVLVHGAFLGGWCWRDVAAGLRAAGHDVFAPTLTGLGERYHLATPDTDLETNVQDIIGVIDWEDLNDIVLVGHSYAGMVVGGVAGRHGDRIKSIIYLDAHIPRDGMSMVDMNPPERAEALQKAAEANNGWQIPPHSAEYYGVRDTALQTWIDGKCVPLPLKCLTSKTDRSAAPHPGIARQAYVRCTDPMMPIFQKSHEWARAQGDWECREIATAHFLMITAPDEVENLLLEYA